MTFQKDIQRADGQLRNLDLAIVRSLPDASEAGAQVFQKGAKRRVQKRSRKLEESIKTKAEKHAPNMSTHLVFSDVFYAPFIEYGTSPHKITKESKRALRIGDDFVTTASHPGNRPFPFFRSTAEQDNHLIARAMEGVILKGVKL